MSLTKTGGECVDICGLCAGIWHQQLSRAWATSTPLQKGAAWGRRSSWEQSHDLPVSPLTQGAIQRGEATTHISSGSSCSVSLWITLLACWPCAVYSVYFICLFCFESKLSFILLANWLVKTALIKFKSNVLQKFKFCSGWQAYRK